MGAENVRPLFPNLIYTLRAWLTFHDDWVNIGRESNGFSLVCADVSGTNCASLSNGRSHNCCHRGPARRAQLDFECTLGLQWRLADSFPVVSNPPPKKK